MGNRIAQNVIIKSVKKFWNEEDIFKKSMENRKEGETYTFYDYSCSDWPCNNI